MNYNAEREYDLFHFAQDYFKRPYQYFTTKEIFFDAVANTAWAATRNPGLFRDPMNSCLLTEWKNWPVQAEPVFKEYSYPFSLFR
ncbi:MAG: hypothetical protein IPF68_00610 [Bacteroidales bacterium]|nr:hypothetical protein [Bacteroidales bacterium]